MWREEHIKPPDFSESAKSNPAAKVGDIQNEERIPVCYILPETAVDTATHFAHKWELIRELEDRVEFFTYQPTFLGIIYSINAFVSHECRTFYVHYSFKGALIAIFLTKLFGGTVFYWNCGLPWLYKRSMFEEHVFQFILRNSIFVTGTEDLAAEYILQYTLDPKRVRIVPNYIQTRRMQEISKNDAREKLSIPADKKVVLFLHRLSRRKGANLLPEIIKEFKDRDDVLFLIVGDGPEKASIELQITNYKLRNLVRFEGKISNNNVPVYIAAADVYLMPSEEEGMPNALLEAMAAGVPFTASDVAAVKEMSPPIAKEFVLPYGDIPAFVEGTKKLLDNEELRERISAEEQTWVNQFDVQVVAKKFLDMIQR